MMNEFNLPYSFHKSPKYDDNVSFKFKHHHENETPLDIVPGGNGGNNRGDFAREGGEAYVPSVPLVPNDLASNEGQTGNERLEEICNALFEQDPGLLILHISEPLGGELDFSFLGQNRRLNEIQFAEQGHITHVRGLPMTLQKLTCTQNELKELTNLPPSLVELNVSHNHLSTVDFIQTPHLRVMRGSNNRLYSLAHLPATLEELYVSHNQLSNIDLLGLNKLRVLHCLYNPHPLILTHVPSQTIDLKMDDGPLNQIQAHDGGGSTGRKSPEKPSIPYVSALNKYMEFKTRYETGARLWREKEQASSSKKKKNTKKKKTGEYPPCFSCKQHVGMTFVRKHNQKSGHVHYYASCGINPTMKQCNFEIELDPGWYDENHHNVLSRYTKEVNQETQLFMQQKMDTLFGYITKDASVDIVKTRLESFIADMDAYANVVHDFHNIYDNKNQQDLIEIQWKKITEIKTKIHTIMDEFRSEPLNRQLLSDAMQIHVTELQPEILRLRRYTYPVMEMTHLIDRNGDIYQSNLFQMTHDLDKIQDELEIPSVITYRIDV